MNHVRSLIADLIEAVRAGDAFLTRLDGEWWMPFQRPARVRASA